MLILLESVFCFFKIYLDFLLEIYIFTNPKIKKVKITSNHMNKTKNFEIEKKRLLDFASHPEETVDVLTYMRQNSLAGGHTLSERREDAYQRILCIMHERFGSPDVLAKMNAIHLITFVGKCPHLFLRLNQQKLCLVIMRQRLKYSAVSVRIWINPRFYLGFFLCFLKKTFFIFSCIYFELSYLYSRYL